MPERWLQCYAIMLPRLSAEEHLGAVSELTAADSWLERRDRQEMLDGWRRQMRGTEEEAERMTEAEFMGKIRAAGLAFDGPPSPPILGGDAE